MTVGDNTLPIVNVEAASIPSAPPLCEPGQGNSVQEPTTSRSGAGMSTGDASKDNSALYEDLLRRASGDRQVVSLWLAEMGYDPAQFREYHSTIKAVGTGEHKLGSWASIGSHSKTNLVGTEDSELFDMKDSSTKDLDTEAAEQGAPKHFFCPISMHIMRDPVMLPTGQSYDRPGIERWLQQGNNTCPATGQPLKPPVVLMPNISLRNAIEEWAERNAPRLLDPSTNRIKPIPKEDSFQQPGALTSWEADRALAIRMQQEELALAHMRQAQLARSMTQHQQQQQGGTVAGDTQQGGRGNKKEWRTLGTLLLLAVSAAYVTIYVLSLWQNDWGIADLSLNPLIGADQAALMTLGAQSAQSLTVANQWWRLLSSGFVSAGAIQLVGNLISLWSFGKYLERMLPLPSLSLPAIFLVSSVLGALASGNLNVHYVTCGASAGVCAFLGGIWADQLFNFKRYSRHLATFCILVVTTLVYIFISLMPLLDPWYTVAALLSGFCCTTIILLLAKVGRDQPGSGGWVCVQAVCAVLLVAGATVAIIGLVIGSDVGEQCGFCQDVSCLQIGGWECVPVGGTNGCRFTVLVNGTNAIECPSGDYQPLPNSVSVSSSELAALCDEYCYSAPGDSGGGSGSSPGGSSGSDIIK